jgi:type II secretory pathway pseudopilin PulG
METINILVRMNLGRQAQNARGYAMAALLIAMSVAAVLMTVAMPVWKQMVQREKEEELVFRGQQYVHAITLYGRKFANTQPPSVDVLINQRFLRKKFKDPITNDDFQLVLATAQAPQQSAGRGGGTGSATPGGASGPSTSATTSSAPRPAATPLPTSTGGSTGPSAGAGGGPTGGIIGVTSKSKDKSIRLYNGRSHYNEWVFMYQPQQTPGAGGPGAGVPGGIPGGVGGRGSGSGGRGGRGTPRGGPNAPGSPRPPGGFGFPGGPPTPRPGGGRF